ncbi:MULTISPECIES: putative quinol monooxygenase [unclassified Ensifer]|uniref:putative quinol monooxygenase n=1 Tax=unclassified Ensifer TaxID=2633371 RepID=UPI000712A276|nr:MULTISPECIES: putative quinol monooxygenase [unclassified Ensifer]KQX43186.1 antibiotic biosynthesis monooxygenase [Ensifer sp. Root1298]KQX72735.1 antibiotic biosynthesis monooxygenase [Ensifer sp. Root1312]KRC15701.1 antibiotic biosynthesis monooxygenase [Ensifer sp. Root74]KRD58976.1 antibiotic biosynthesis monooxygenase [Ensifer sp. Root954]
MTSTKSDEQHLIVEFKCETPNRDRVKELLQEFIGPARGEDGCLYYDLYQRADDPNTFFILDGWSSQAAAAGHGEHPNVRRVLEHLLPLLVRPPSIIVSKRISD